MRLQNRHGLKMDVKRPTIALVPYISIRFPVQYKWPELFLAFVEIRIEWLISKSFCCPHLLTYTKSTCAFSKALFINSKHWNAHFLLSNFHEIRWKCKSTEFNCLTSQRIVHSNFAPATSTPIWTVRIEYTGLHKVTATKLDSKNNAWDGNVCSNVRVGRNGFSFVKILIGIICLWPWAQKANIRSRQIGLVFKCMMRHIQNKAHHC